MKKLQILVLLSLTIFSFQAAAQIAIGLGGGILKSTEDNTDALLGGELYVKYDVTDQIRAGINFGYYSETDKIGETKFVSSLVPISIAGEYVFLEDKFRPYIGVHLGLLRAGFKAGSTNVSDAYFSLAPVAGVDYQLTDNIGLNLNFKYGFAFYKNDFTDEIDNFSTISPNIGVFYKL